VRVLSQLSGKEYVYNALALALEHNLNEVAVTIIEQIKFITDGSEIAEVSVKKKAEPVEVVPADGKVVPLKEEAKKGDEVTPAPVAEGAPAPAKEETKPVEAAKPVEGEKPAEVVATEKPAEPVEEIKPAEGAATPAEGATPAPVKEEIKPAEAKAEKAKPAEVKAEEKKPAEKVLTKEEKAKAKKEADAAKKAEKDKKDQEKKIADAKKKEEDARIKEEEKTMTPEQKKVAREQRAKDKKLAEIASKNSEVKPEAEVVSNVKEGELIGIAAPLVNALMYKDQRVRYEAAMTVAFFNPKKTFPYAEKVVELLASALGEKDQVAVLVIDSDNQRNLKVSQMLRDCGFLVVSAENGVDGILYSRSFPSKDLVLIAGDLKGKNAERVYAELQADYRTKKTPVSIISDQVSKVRMTEKYAHITADIFTPEDGKDAYLLMVRKIMETAEAPASAKLEKENVAIKAAQALATIKREGTVFTLESSFDASIKVLSPPERVDEIRLPVLQAMAQFKAKPVLPAIIDTYLKDANAKPIRLASLYAIGEIDPNDPKGVDALILAVQNTNDIDYRKEASGALGKGNHKAEKVTELLQDLRIKKESK
jgi:CheY-like chemotaxis protein